MVKHQTNTTDGGPDYITSEDENNFLENSPDSQVKQVTQTTTPSELHMSDDKTITHTPHTTSTTNETTYNEMNVLAMNHSLFDSHKTKKNNTGLLPEMHSSGEPDESDMQAVDLETEDPYTKGHLPMQNDSNEINDEILEVEELIADQDSNSSSSANGVDLLFSSGEPDEGVIFPEQIKEASAN